MDELINRINDGQEVDISPEQCLELFNNYYARGFLKAKSFNTHVFKGVIASKDDWNNISIPPPDKIVRCRDEKGNIFIAKPIYYPFKIGKSNAHFLHGEIMYCEPYWDGSWQVQVTGGKLPIHKIIEWKLILE